MCPVLSLANRAFSALLGTLLAFTSLPTQAEDLQFDLTGTAYTPSNNFFPGAGPIDLSFVLDTQSGTGPVLTYGNGRPDQTTGTCLQHFGVTGAVVSNLNMTLNGRSLFSGNAIANYRGDNPAGCPGGFFAAMLFNNGLGLAFDPSPGISQAALTASSDPMATMFLNFQPWSSHGTWDGYNLDFGSARVANEEDDDRISVPEPGPLGLLMLGFAGVVLCGRKRISVRAPALSA